MCVLYPKNLLNWGKIPLKQRKSTLHNTQEQIKLPHSQHNYNNTSTKTSTFISLTRFLSPTNSLSRQAVYETQKERKRGSNRIRTKIHFSRKGATSMSIFWSRGSLCSRFWTYKSSTFNTLILVIFLFNLIEFLWEIFQSTDWDLWGTLEEISDD